MRRTTLISLVLTYLTFGLWTLEVTAQFIKLHDFDGINGTSPDHSLIYKAPFLYGTTRAGGSNGLGIIFRIKPDGTEFLKLREFNGTGEGGTPTGSLVADSTFLYGMTSRGGADDKGIIFKVKPDGTDFSNIFNFSLDTAKGSNPSGSLISVGTYLYGMTPNGGANGLGIIFKIKPDGTGFSKLFDFDIANGQRPYGSLCYDGTFLYGMAGGGGISNFGTVFKIKPDGTGFLKLLDFTGTANGQFPHGTLISDGTFLYGMANYGGTNNQGTIFKIKTDGTMYSTIINFDSINGSYPSGALIFDGTVLYGLTGLGGENNYGVLFKIMTDGSGYSNLFNFDGVANGSNTGSNLISLGNFLYGMAGSGGASNDGTIYKYGISTGISENNTSIDFTVFPNPNAGLFNVQYKSSERGTLKLSITNYLGQEVYTQSFSGFNGTFNKELNLSTQPPGIYNIQLTTDKQVIVRRVVVE